MKSENRSSRLTDPSTLGMHETRPRVIKPWIPPARADSGFSGAKFGLIYQACFVKRFWVW